MSVEARGLPTETRWGEEAGEKRFSRGNLSVGRRECKPPEGPN